MLQLIKTRLRHRTFIMIGGNFIFAIQLRLVVVASKLSSFIGALFPKSMQLEELTEDLEI